MIYKHHKNKKKADVDSQWNSQQPQISAQCLHCASHFRPGNCTGKGWQ